MVVSHRGDDELVSRGRVPQLLKLPGYLTGRADELRIDPVSDQRPVLRRPGVCQGLLRGRELDRALRGPDAPDPQPVSGRQLARGCLIFGDYDVGGDSEVGPAQLGRWPERRPVAGGGLQYESPRLTW